MEDAGAVFLPVAGERGGTNVYDVGAYGYYWSSTPYTNNDWMGAYYMYFNSNYFGATIDINRFHGYSVRLVRNNN